MKPLYLAFLTLVSTALGAAAPTLLASKSCTPDMDELLEMDAWKEMPVATIIQQWGEPTAKLNTPDGAQIQIYLHGFGNDASCVCQVQVTVDNTQQVEDWRIDTDKCATTIDNG